MLNMDQLKILAEKYQFNTLYLFGSFANASFNEKSDIDLAYLSDNRETTIDNGAFYYDIKKYIPREVDLIDLRRAPLTFAFQIISEGRIIYDREPELRTDFEDELIRNYLDYAVCNRMMNRDIAANFGLEADG